MNLFGYDLDNVAGCSEICYSAKMASRDFVPWRFSDAGRMSAWLALSMPASEKPAQKQPFVAPQLNRRNRPIAEIQTGIDMAAYVLTDWPVMQALTRAADRGVHIRIYLDGTQFAEREPVKVFNDLAETPGVEIRIKHKARDPMHLKSYQIDGTLLRTGAANFSASGLKRQDNDLIVIESAGAAASFKRNFDARFATGEALSAGSR
jgi:phosphatidylserine/phosphatidylglycerophosphate/cardiolipin synthase-like enzyme